MLASTLLVCLYPVESNFSPAPRRADEESLAIAGSLAVLEVGVEHLDYELNDYLFL